MPLHILVATMSGTAESVAQSLQLACSDAFDPIHIHRMETIDAGIFDEDAVFLICSSTYGSGDVPDNGQALYAQLDAEPRYLGHVRYGLVALGDSSYGDTYGLGGLQFLLQGQRFRGQRQRLVERFDLRVEQLDRCFHLEHALI